MQKNTYGLIDRHPSDMVALGHEGGSIVSAKAYCSIMWSYTMIFNRHFPKKISRNVFFIERHQNVVRDITIGDVWANGTVSFSSTKSFVNDFVSRNNNLHGGSAKKRSLSVTEGFVQKSSHVAYFLFLLGEKWLWLWLFLLMTDVKRRENKTRPYLLEEKLSRNMVDYSRSTSQVSLPIQFLCLSNHHVPKWKVF